MKKILVAAVVLSFGTAYAGEWHAGQTNLCSDCHTMHFSMQHQWNSSDAVAAGPHQGGNWLGSQGPNNFLLKAPANELCLACHDNQSFAPDVLGATTNAGLTQGRAAGALNSASLGSPYDTYKGHTLGSTTSPPGYPTGATFYTGTTDGLECISCHAQHGSATSYRNLGPYSIPGVTRPTYVIGTANDSTKDVWINIAAPYAANSGLAATFNPYYDSANVSFNRNDTVKAAYTGGTAKTVSNGMDAFCGTCHGNFHGGFDAPTVAGTATSANIDGFIRHPTSGVTIGASTFGGHSSLSRFVANTTKVKVYASNRATYADASPGCLSCHKAHGNQNPFGLVFLARSAASVGEEGGYAASQTQDLKTGYRNLCGQCHSQGADSTSATAPN